MELSFVLISFGITIFCIWNGFDGIKKYRQKWGLEFYILGTPSGAELIPVPNATRREQLHLLLESTISLLFGLFLSYITLTNL